MFIAFYKANGNYIDKIIRFVDGGKHSHVELIFPEQRLMCSSSPRDGGVRTKQFTGTPDNWDFYDIGKDFRHKEAAALDWFSDHNLAKYDWIGCINTQLGRFKLPQCMTRWFCVEAVSDSIGLRGQRELGVREFHQFISSKYPQVDFGKYLNSPAKVS